MSETFRCPSCGGRKCDVQLMLDGAYVFVCQRCGDEWPNETADWAGGNE